MKTMLRNFKLPSKLREVKSFLNCKRGFGGLRVLKISDYLNTSKASTSPGTALGTPPGQAIQI